MRCDRAKNGKGERGSPWYKSIHIFVQAQCSAIVTLKGLLNYFVSL